MGYTTILVNQTLGAANGARCAVALDLAEKCDARLIGIAAAAFSPPLYFAEGEAAQRLIDNGEASIAEGLSRLEAGFRAAMGLHSKSIEWRSSREMPARYVAREARAADIIVTGQSGRQAPADPFLEASASDLVMQAGRPVLVVPDAVRWLDVRSCLVAWKETPEARRAVFDALPLLRLAREVTVCEVLEQGADKNAVRARLRDVAAWLGRQRIMATELVAPPGGDVVERLDRVVANVGAGLIVAGAYGHSRVREWVFGGVTRWLLQADRCALLSR